MALYPTPAGERMAWDRDGSAFVIVGINTGQVADLTAGYANKFNSEIADNSNSSNWVSQPSDTRWAVLFPELRDVVGCYISGQTAGGFLAPSFIQYSTNTTTGFDGTWTNIVTNPTWSDVGAAGNPDTGYRSPNAFSVSGVKAIGILYSSGGGSLPNHPSALGGLHLYGNPSSGQNPDSLRMWQPVTNAELTTVLDFGDIARGTAATQQFRVHNQSATKTAHTITLSMEALTDSSPSQIGQYQLSTDNATWANTISIPDLGPGATSAVLYVRDTVATGAQLSLWACRIIAAAGSFI